MDAKEIQAIIRDIQASPTECEWVEIKHDNEDPESIGEYVSALANGAAYMGQSRGFMAWGLDDKTHQIVGTKFNPKTAKYGNEELENWISRSLSPRIDFSFQEILDGISKEIGLESCAAFQIDEFHFAWLSTSKCSNS